MPNRYFVMFLLVLLLSMGTVMGQSNDRIALMLTPTETGLNMSVMQVGSTCVPNYSSRYMLWKYTDRMNPIFQVPADPWASLSLGDMEGWQGGQFYHYPRLRWLTGAGLGDAWAGRDPVGIYLMQPYAATQNPTAACPDPIVFHSEIPVVIMGTLNEFPQVFRGLGAAVKTVTYNPVTNMVVFYVVAFHPTRVVVFETTENQRGEEATRQKAFEAVGTGEPERFEVALAAFGPEVKAHNKVLYVHLYDKVSGFSTKETLADWGRKVYDERGDYITSQYYKLFVGDGN